MSRLSTGNPAPSSAGYTTANPALSEIVSELREALGAIPEVTKLYGSVAETIAAYEQDTLRGDGAPSANAYSIPVSKDKLAYTTAVEEEKAPIASKPAVPNPYVSPVEDVRPAPPIVPEAQSEKAPPEKLAYTTAVDEEKEPAASKSASPNPYVSSVAGINPAPPAPDPDSPIAEAGSDAESKSAESKFASAMYVGDLSKLGVGSPAADPMAAVAAPADPSAAATYESVKKETDHQLAKLARFVPDKLREALDKKFTDAVKLSQDKSDESYAAATLALTKLQESLDSKAPELRSKENDFLRKQVQHSLDNEDGVLPKDDKKAFVDRFSALDTDLPPEESEAKSQLGNLQTLSSEIDEAIDERLKAISDLCVDFERLAPIVKRALSIKSDRHADLEKGHNEIEEGFGGQFVRDGLAIADIQSKLSSLEKTVQDVFKSFTVKDALKEQKQSLPASPASLQPKGAALGAGAFGEVFELANDGGKKLVGKSFPAANAEAKKEMEHEAEIYARLGENTNIAKCYGIHEIDDPARGKSSMLVMDKIEGKDVEKVFDDLNKRYKEKKVTREEYMAATQHLIKGTLKGLAHMEAMGLVHKDIKGDNVKFDTRTNQAVLIDMGLAQAEGEHENVKNFFPIAPPEQFHQKTGVHDKVVTTFWDSFTVGKMLFEEMERDDQGKRNVLITGSTPVEKKSLQDLFAKVPQMVKGARDAVKRTDAGEFEAKSDAQGQLIGQALKPATTPDEAAEAGRYGAATQYVDFMNRLTHPDPKQRLKPSEALKHPFMTDALRSPEELEKVFGKPTGSEPKEEKKRKPAEAVAADEGPRLNLDDLAEAYSGKKESQPAVADSLEDHSGEEDLGPRIDTDELAHAYDVKSGSAPEVDELEEKGAPPESEEKNEDPGIDKPNVTDSKKKSGAPNPYVEVVSHDDDLPEKKSPKQKAPDKKSANPYVTVIDDESKSTESESKEKQPAKTSSKTKQPVAAKAQSAEDVEAALMKGTTALQRWQLAQQQVDQQFNSAYSNLAGDKARLKAAGLSKGKKFSDYFTYNKSLHKLIKSLEDARKKSSKDVPKHAAKVTAATQHYRDKIIQKAETDFGWANAKPAIQPAFWKTLVAALDDVDKWVNS